MKDQNDILSFKEFASWVATLKKVDTDTWFKPISTGKWSISEIVAHIMNWDNYLISKILPSIRKGEGMVFPDFDTYNQRASVYSRSGVSQAGLIAEVIQIREQLVTQLWDMPDTELHEHLTANGVSHCPHTGTPYSLSYILKEFVAHDNHHKQQIIYFLRENGLA